ncbi:MAG: hypothetical protein HRU38_13040 [Saccharospirillaceae bacterium]|nr:hypothetical protein [Pseudomonadales bacterium]NRB79569.1 hypothetical protein [Saccharospirillaceae bacterium]
MIHPHTIAVIDPHQNFPYFHELSEQFTIQQIENEQILIDNCPDEIHLIIIWENNATVGIELASKLNNHENKPPTVLFIPEITPDERITAYQGGVDDLPEQGIAVKEIIARCFRLIFDQIANKQLRSQVQHANQMAHMAMANTSDLGVNIQFLLQCNQCKDLNELSVCIFNSLKNYDIHCSLQIRGKYEEKNVEENGMAREMESKLLTQMKDNGRYYDFGQRSIMNYENVSLLVKNMPIDNEEKYGMLKDNVFSLLQGLSARVIALDNEMALELEMETIMMLTKRMQKVMKQNEESSMATMKQCIENLEDVALKMEEILPFLGITLPQEEEIETMLTVAIDTNQKIFSHALESDDTFSEMLTNINAVLSNKVNGKVDFDALHRYM